jgi:PilZ domain
MSWLCDVRRVDSRSRPRMADLALPIPLRPVQCPYCRQERFYLTRSNKAADMLTTGCPVGVGFWDRKAPIVTLQPIGESEKGETSASRERRLSHRVGCKGFADAIVVETGYLFRGEIRDISQTGCYLMTNARTQLERLTEVDLLFVLNNRQYHTLARVMKIRPGKGVGLEFMFSDRAAEESFKELIFGMAAPVTFPV